MSSEGEAQTGCLHCVPAKAPFRDRDIERYLLGELSDEDLVQTIEAALLVDGDLKKLVQERREKQRAFLNGAVPPFLRGDVALRR